MRPTLLSSLALSLLLVLCSSCKTSSKLGAQANKVMDSLSNIPQDPSALYAMSLSSRLDYEELQERGGLIVRTPELWGSRYWLPVYANVAGAANLTRSSRDFAANTALYQVEVTTPKKEPNTLLLFLRESRSSKRTPTANAHGADLGPLPAGVYSLHYLNRDGSRVDLGKFEVPEALVVEETVPANPDAKEPRVMGMEMVDTARPLEGPLKRFSR